MPRKTMSRRSDRRPLAEPSHGAEPVVWVQDVSHDFGSTEHPMPVLHAVDLRVEAGEIVLMTGPSGSGKTTLLTLIGALRSLQQGSLRVLGQELLGLDAEQRVQVRRGLGFIFQQHNLFDALTALQNVRLALELHGGTRRQLDDRCREILDAVGLGDRLHHKPEALSGGQRQRVAVARALAARPALILADEPTAALDAGTSRQVIELLQTLAREQGTSTLLVTHDARILDTADRIVNMVDGRIVSNVKVGESLEICEFLTRVPGFADQTPGALAEIAEQMHRRRVVAGETLFRQGDIGDELFIIREGAIRIVDDADGEELAVLESGEFFGEAALLEDQPRNASAIALRDSELFTLGKAQFRAALERRKSLREQLLELLATRS